MASSTGATMLTDEEKEELSGYDYPFENVAFEGGGNKGSAYIGAIRVLEEIGVWKNIRRISGASIGAISAAWAAVGYTSYEIEDLCDRDLKRICHDAKFGLMNLYRSYGWHPGSRLYKWLGTTFEDKTGDPDITFFELYRKYGRELCITTTNLNQLDCVYCHVKTTPDLPIRMAIRMSLSIPGVFSPVKYNMYTTSDLFVDGGLLCNYPIQVFDGWFLSMEPGDNFLKRIPRSKDFSQAWDIRERFGERNDRTIGMLLYSEDEQELMKLELEKREQKYLKNSSVFPDTALTRKRKTLIARRTKNAETHDKLSEAMEAFLLACSNCDFDCSGTISKEELKQVLNKENGHMTKAQVDLLFGENATVDELFKRLDTDESGDLSFQELIYFAEQRGVALMSNFRGFNSRPINSVGDYFNAIMDSLMINIKRLVVNGDDLDRTVGINTKYLDTLDFDLESQDKLFLVEQGKLGCIAFLRYYIETKKPQKKSLDSNRNGHTQCQSPTVKTSFDLEKSPEKDTLEVKTSEIDRHEEDEKTNTDDVAVTTTTKIDEDGKLSSDQDGKLSSDQGDTLSPDQDGKLSPDQDGKLSSDQGDQLSPDQQVKLLPDQEV
ncbi:uncharacterized protein [Amphiura filiformis]|uniref:uncharacterized protein n=1 Tax=Amphiura filiformis TaxID=82378 RepID=UPI003B224751